MTPTRMTQMKSALLPTKERSADPKDPPVKGEPMHSTTNRRPPSTPRGGTAAHTALLALSEAGPAGVCPQKFFDDTGKSLKHAVQVLRRCRWCIESRWIRQRVESEMLYVLGEV